MRGMGITLQVTVDKTRLLDILRRNRSKHIEMYEEAVAGFVDKATERLTFEIERAAKDRGRKSIHFRMEAPTNHSSEYDTVINMLELHTEDTVTLHADEVRMLVEDEWAWMRNWLTSNSRYSASSRAYAAEKYGADGLDD